MRSLSGIRCFECLLLAALSAAATVDVELVPLHAEVEEHRPGEELVMFQITVPEVAPKVQPPPDRDLIIVLDTSASMYSGEKLQTAKEAIARVVESSLESDRVHLITYSGAARTVTKGQESQSQLLDLVEGLKARGQTNLYAGLEQVEDLLGVIGEKRTAKRIFLFSDGLVNQGVTDRNMILEKVHLLLQRGAPTSAFGIGVGYDEELMAGIAESGQGRFFFIEGASDMGKVVEVATEGFRSLFATRAELHLAGMGGARVRQIFTNRFAAGGVLRTASVDLGDLRASEQRQLLVELELPGMPVGAAEVVEYRLACRSLSGEEACGQSGTLSLTVVPTGSEVKPANPSVAHFRRLRVALQQEAEVERRVRAGDFEGARDVEAWLDGELGSTAAACEAELPDSSICRQAAIAHDRTQKSRAALAKAEEHPEVAKRAYSMKRWLHSFIWESEKEL